MNERAIHIASVNREKRGKDSPSDFVIKFNPPLKLDPQMSHSIALDRLLMIYSWYNTIKYSHNSGNDWQTITFVDGAYSYSDINDYIHPQYMDQKHHHSTDSKGAKQYHINLSFVLSTYNVLITLDNNYQLDLRGTEFADLKLISKTECGTKLPNITNSIDVLNINTSAIKKLYC